MATVQQLAPAYFASINPIARKIMKDQENLRDLYQNEWEELDFDKREELINDHLIDSTVREFYRDHPKPDAVPDYYPKLVVDSGEKIIIDFDNDGWTWQDEHSAPFSWETKSQMNMPMDDVEEDARAAKLKKIKRPKSPKFVERCPSDTPLVDDKPAGSSTIWNSPFMAADRGHQADFSGKPEDEHQSETVTDTVAPVANLTPNTNADDLQRISFIGDNESSDDIFKKYGISFGNRVSPARSIDKASSPARAFGGNRGSSPARSLESHSSERSSPSRFGRLSPKRTVKKSKDQDMEKSLLPSRDDSQGVVNFGLDTRSESDTEISEMSSIKSSSHEYGVINYGQDGGAQRESDEFSKAFGGVTSNVGADFASNFEEPFSELQVTDAPRETDLINEPSPSGSLYDNSEPAPSVGDDFSSRLSPQPTESLLGSGEPDPADDPSAKTGFDFLDNW